jgi:hypothetical protein
MAISSGCGDRADDALADQAVIEHAGDFLCFFSMTQKKKTNEKLVNATIVVKLVDIQERTLLKLQTKKRKKITPLFLLFGAQSYNR